MGYRVVTAPQSEPLEVEEVRDHLRLVTTTEDNYLSALIAAARGMVEQYTNRALITQTWDVALDAFPTWFDIPGAPLQSVASLSYVDGNGVTTDLYNSISSPQVGIGSFVIDTYSQPARFLLPYGGTWPTPITQANAVILRAVVGYGDTGASVPAPIRQAMLLLIGHWYEHRESVSEVQNLAEMPQGAVWLLNPYRIMSVV